MSWLVRLWLAESSLWGTEWSLTIVFLTEPIVLEVSFLESSFGLSGDVLALLRTGLLVGSIFFLEKPPAADSAQMSLLKWISSS